MSTNPDDINGTQIPGAPGFMFPEGLSPEERDAFLLRLRFGPSLFKSGQDFSSAGGDYTTAGGANPNAGPGVVNPSIVQNFLRMANTQAPQPMSHSAQMAQRILNVESPGSQVDPNITPELAQPQDEQEYQAAYPPGAGGVYSPEQQQSYEQFAGRLRAQRGYEEQQGKQKVAEEGAQSKSDLADARAKELEARAELNKARAENPGAFQRGGGSIDARVNAALGLNTPAVVAPTPAASATAAPAGRQVKVGDANIRPGDWVDVGNGKRKIWDGRKWSLV